MKFRHIQFSFSFFAPNLTEKKKMSDKEKEFKAYKEDTRIPCQYGAKCYQKNAIHHQKYKHPPAKETV